MPSYLDLPIETLVKIKELYAETDGRGRRIWSHMALAKRFCVGETTIYRVVNEVGAYAGLNAHRLARDIPDEEIQASKEKLRRKLAEEKEVKPVMGGCGRCGKTKYLCTCGLGNFLVVNSPETPVSSPMEPFNAFDEIEVKDEPGV